MCRRTLAGMVGAVKAVGLSWDGSFVVGGSDEGNGLEIVRISFPSSSISRLALIDVFAAGGKKRAGGLWGSIYFIAGKLMMSAQKLRHM